MRKLTFPLSRRQIIDHLSTINYQNTVGPVRIDLRVHTLYIELTVLDRAPTGRNLVDLAIVHTNDIDGRVYRLSQRNLAVSTLDCSLYPAQSGLISSPLKNLCIHLTPAWRNIDYARVSTIGRSEMNNYSFAISNDAYRGNIVQAYSDGQDSGLDAGNAKEEESHGCYRCDDFPKVTSVFARIRDTIQTLTIHSVWRST